MELEQTECDGVVWINLAHNTAKWKTLLNLMCQIAEWHQVLKERRPKPSHTFRLSSTDSQWERVSWPIGVAGGGWGSCCGRPGQQTEYSKLKLLFLRSTNLKSFRQINGNSINQRDLLKFRDVYQGRLAPAPLSGPTVSPFSSMWCSPYNLKKEQFCAHVLNGSVKTPFPICTNGQG